MYVRGYEWAWLTGVVVWVGFGQSGCASLPLSGSLLEG